MNSRVILMGAAGALALAAVASSARADALVDEAKAVVEKATARADKWDGPTSGPKAVAKKTVVYVAGDMRNGGILGVAHGLKEAADVLGWTYREIDGQGTVSGQASGLSQAVALKPDAIVQLGPKWTHSLAINDLYYDSMGPSLQVAGLKGDGDPQNISAGDGSESAYQRIRDKDYQSATVPEPLNMRGWQLADELNRAFAHEKWWGFVPGVHLVTAANIAFDGGPKNVFDPDNGYRDQYKTIWGAK